MVDDYQQFKLYRQYQDQLVQELLQPQHAGQLQANIVSGDIAAIEKYCRHYIDLSTGEQLPEIRERLYVDVPKVVRDYIRYRIEHGT